MREGDAAKDRSSPTRNFPTRRHEDLTTINGAHSSYGGSDRFELRVKICLERPKNIE